MGLLTNPGKNLTRNDAFDWFHAVVPVAYCQGVLLDGHWARQTEIVVDTLANGGLRAQMAAIFSGRGNGVERFLREIEGEG